MKTYTRVSLGRDFDKDLLKTINFLENSLVGQKNILLNDFYVVNNLSLHAVAKTLQRLENDTYAKILAKSILQSENLSGSSAIVGLRFFCHLSKEMLLNKPLLSNARLFQEELTVALDTCKRNIEGAIVPANSESIVSLVKTCLADDKVLAEALLKSVFMAGVEGKIYLEDSKSSSAYVIEKHTGYEFDTRPLKIFLGNKTSSGFDLSEPRILLVDGIVETVAEIDQILRKMFETKESMVIVARGFSEEVVATLKANFDRGLLNIIPVVLESNLESLNVLNDIACVCGSTVISSLTGEFLSMVKADDLAKVSKIRCLPDKMVVENAQTFSSVVTHIDYLLKKRFDNQSVEDITNLYDKRIKALSQNTVILRLPVMSAMESQTKKAKADVVLRDIKTLVNHGHISVANFLNTQDSSNKDKSEIVRIFNNSVRKTMAQLGDAQVSSLSVYLGIYLFTKLAGSLLTSSAMISVIEPDQLVEQ